MTIKPWLERAGKFTVEHIGGIPHFNQTVDSTAPPTGVLHTTEGGWDGSLAVFKEHYAPHFMVGPGRIAQLVQVGTIGAALVTHNWIPVVQVEMVGFSKETLWQPDNATAETMAALMAACRDEYGIPLSRPWADGVFGKARPSDPHRAEGKFGHLAGWYGHCDAPSPDSHWDPGALEWSYLFSLAGAVPAALPAPVADPPPRPCAHHDLTTYSGLWAALAALGYRAPTIAEAVKEFQTATGGLAVDGIAGPLTKSAITRRLAA